MSVAENAFKQRGQYRELSQILGLSKPDPFRSKIGGLDMGLDVIALDDWLMENPEYTVGKSCSENLEAIYNKRAVDLVNELLKSPDCQ